MKEWKLPAIISELNLTSEDLFVDIGGYKGDATASATALFGCQAIIYEPFPEFYEKCRKRFDGNELVLVEMFGLGLEGKRELFYNDLGTSLFQGENGIEVIIKEANEVLSSLKPKAIKINAEGAEYEILDSLEEFADDMLIQFHYRKQGMNEDYLRVHEKLSLTHKKLWERKRWELWRRFPAIQ